MKSSVSAGSRSFRRNLSSVTRNGLASLRALLIRLFISLLFNLSPHFSLLSASLVRFPSDCCHVYPLTRNSLARRSQSMAIRTDDSLLTAAQRTFHWPSRFSNRRRRRQFPCSGRSPLAHRSDGSFGGLISRLLAQERFLHHKGLLGIVRYDPSGP